MNKTPNRTVGPIEVKPGPRGILSFYAGQILEHEKTGIRVLVLSTSDDGQKALLFPLDEPERKPFEANASWAVGWDDALLDGPRFVELYKKGEEKPLWAAYVPHFSAACGLWKYYFDQAGKLFELVIHCQHNSEWQHLEALGYFNNGRD